MRHSRNDNLRPGLDGEGNRIFPAVVEITPARSVFELYFFRPSVRRPKPCVHKSKPIRSHALSTRARPAATNPGRCDYRFAGRSPNSQDDRQKCQEKMSLLRTALAAFASSKGTSCNKARISPNKSIFLSNTLRAGPAVTKFTQIWKDSGAPPFSCEISRRP